MGTDNSLENVENSIEACRTCGTYFVSSSNLLRQLFDNPPADIDMSLIRKQLNIWEIKITESDVYSKYICTGCINEFQRIFKFRRTCIETQSQLQYFQKMREENIKIKTELIDQEAKANNFTFIYVDDISDNEAEESNVYFKLNHLPIKIEREGEEVSSPNEGASQSALESLDKNMHYNKDLYLAPIKKESEGELSSGVFQEERNLKKCNFCAYTTESSNDMNYHMDTCHETKDHECHVCGKKFNKTTFMRFKYHLKWHKISKHIKCTQCGFYCTSKQILNEHRRTVHAKIPCGTCGKCFTSKRLKLHVLEHQLDCSFGCEACDKVFSRKYELEKHKWQFHNRECFTEAYVSDDEMDVIETNTFVICAKCNGTFTTPEELTKHVQETHEEKSQRSLNNIYNNYNSNNFNTNNENSVPISIDDEDSESETNCQDDLPISENAESLFKFQCSICLKIFETVEALQDHHLLHTKSKASFKCTFCSKSFELKFSLNRHMKKHR